MNNLYWQCERAWRKLKNWVELNLFASQSEMTRVKLKHRKWGSTLGITRQITNFRKKVEDVIVEN